MRRLATSLAVIILVCLAAACAMAQVAPSMPILPNSWSFNPWDFSVAPEIQAARMHMGLTFNAPGVDLSIKGADLWVGVAGLSIKGPSPISLVTRFGWSSPKDIQVLQAEDPTFQGGLNWEGSGFRWVFGDLQVAHSLGPQASIICGYR